MGLVVLRAAARRARGRHLGWRGAVVGIVLVGVLAASAVAVAGPARSRLAARLAARDPGALIGGNTIVGSSNGDLLRAVPDRINFIIALGSGETIVGGRGADQLGALGRNETIRGGGGNDLIHGGPGHDMIYGGPGNDLIIDTKGTATISTGGGRNEVEVAGHSGRDQVRCAPGSVDRIDADRGDDIAPACRRAPGSQVVYRPRPTAADNAQVARDPNGCTKNPNVDCEYLAAAGSLEGLWWSQKTPQRQCPPDHPYLRNVSYVPWGTTAPKGVEMVNLGNVGFVAPSLIDSDRYLIGTQVGSVTNWTLKSQGWEMWFHCTSDKSRGYQGHGGVGLL